MPAASALLLTAFTGGRMGLKNLLRPLKIWRINWRWWAAALLVQPAILIISGLVYNWIWGNPPVEAIPVASAGTLAVNIFFLIIASLGEETGWRGLALPELQKRFSPLTASVILGLVWATWHLPFYLLLDIHDQYGFSYLGLNYLFVFPFTIFITWFFNHGRSSLLLAVVFHVVFNIVNTALFPVTSSIGAFGVVIALEWMAALLIFRHLKPIVSEIKHYMQIPGTIK
jgi:membrane protease YdiL (CAAX protease family)